MVGMRPEEASGRTKLSAWASWRINAIATMVVTLGFSQASHAEPARPQSGSGECSLWGKKLSCGASKRIFACRDAGSGDVAPSPGAEKLLVCHATAKNTPVRSKLVVLSSNGKMLDVVSDRVDTSRSSLISSVKVNNVVVDKRREVVVEYRFDPKVKAKVGATRQGSIRHREVSILRWAGSVAAGSLREVLRVCTMQRPQPVRFARAAKISYQKGSRVRVEAKQQEYYGEKVRQWWSDVTYVWDDNTEGYLASSCTDLADPIAQTLGHDEPEGDVNGGMRCIGSRLRKTVSKAPPKVATPRVPTDECRAPAGTTLSIPRLNISSQQGGSCPAHAVKAAQERVVRLNVSGKTCGQLITHRESFSVSTSSGCSYELVLRGKLARRWGVWTIDEEQILLRSHCERGPSCQHGLTTERGRGKVATAQGTDARSWGKAPPSREKAATPSVATPPRKAATPWGKAPPPNVATAKVKVASPDRGGKATATQGHTTSQCLARLQREQSKGRLLRECYESIVGLAENDALRECDIGELSRSLCR